MPEYSDTSVRDKQRSAIQCLRSKLVGQLPQLQQRIDHQLLQELTTVEVTGRSQQNPANGRRGKGA